jgi:NAD(P)-dependent dehydrogenase (short-subunit alcohol dehydrogenase family)
MARIFITGSADGLGQMAARLLVAGAHHVVLHARHVERAREALAAVPGAQSAVFGDLSRVSDMHSVAVQVNALGPFDAIIHNAGIGYRERRRIATVDGLPQLFAVNTLAPYVLTALIQRPRRLVYLSSGMHQGGDASLRDLEWNTRPWNGAQAYSDSKLHDVILAFAVARRWLAISDDPAALVTGEYFYHQRLRTPVPAARDPNVQDRLLDVCAALSGVPFPP